MTQNAESLASIGTDEVTDSDLEEALRYVGVTIPSEHYNTCASHDAIRHFAMAIADDNPLWVDEEYARKTRWGGIIAPPSFLMSVNNGAATAGLKGMLRLAASWDIHYTEPVRVGTQFQTSTTIVDAALVERNRGGRMIRHTAETHYRDRDGRLLARGRCDSFRLPMKGGSSVGYVPRQPEYTSEEIGDIETQILAEIRRGAERLLPNEIKIGDTLGQVVKGPISLVDQLCWYAAYNMIAFGGWPLESAVRKRDQTGVRDLQLQHAAKTHADMARQVGMPGIWVSSPAVFSWFVQLLTNWHGDDGFLRRIRLAVRRPVVLGDTVWCTGLVKAIDGINVECELRGTNQIGEEVVHAAAWVELPRA
jgi:acyl dehydratase